MQPSMREGGLYGAASVLGELFAQVAFCRMPLCLQAYPTESIWAYGLN